MEAKALGLTKLDNIKNLYNEVKDKEQFIVDLAKDWNMNFRSVHTNWFMQWNIPDKYTIQERLVERLQKIIAIQNGVPV